MTEPDRSHRYKSLAFHGPSTHEEPELFVRQGLPTIYPDIYSVADVVESLTAELEGKLDVAQAGLTSKD
ncbi:hypothetical protein RHI9324_04809 [Rhizobium sp. CECT 9324]|nr:hypothetical protein RHI9324_04809 [Rhizobium sp. CECT 9324]